MGDRVGASRMGMGSGGWGREKQDVGRKLIYWGGTKEKKGRTLGGVPEVGEQGMGSGSF